MLKTSASTKKVEVQAKVEAQIKNIRSFLGLDLDLSLLCPGVLSYSILGLEKVKMIRRSGAVTDRQAMANGLGEIGLGCLYGVVHGFASCEMCRNCRGKRAARAMCVGRIDELSLEHIEEPAVIKQIGTSFCQ